MQLSMLNWANGYNLWVMWRHVFRKEGVVCEWENQFFVPGLMLHWCLARILSEALTTNWQHFLTMLRKCCMALYIDEDYMQSFKGGSSILRRPIGCEIATPSSVSWQATTTVPKTVFFLREVKLLPLHRPLQCVPLIMLCAHLLTRHKTRSSRIIGKWWSFTIENNKVH